LLSQDFVQTLYEETRVSDTRSMFLDSLSWEVSAVLLHTFLNKTDFASCSQQQENL